MLAFAPRAVLEQVLAAGLARRTPRTVIAPGLLDRELAASRARGGRGARESTSDACVAAPVLDNAGRAVAAISITGLGPTGWTPALRSRGAQPPALGLSPHAARRLTRPVPGVGRLRR